MARRVRLNSRGVAATLKSDSMARVVSLATESVARGVRDQGIRVGDRDGGRHEYALPVETSMTTTDRAHGRVTLAHPAGEAVQAKHGALTKAAAQAGLDVRAKK